MFKHLVLWLGLFISTIANGQINSIELRNDSLFINGTLIPDNPTISFLNEAFGNEAKLKRVKNSYRRNGSAKFSDVFIYDGGINIKKYNYDSLHLRLGVKLRDNTYKRRDKTFKGLYTGRFVIDGVNIATIGTEAEILSAGYDPVSVNVGEIKVLLAYEKGRTGKTFISIQRIAKPIFRSKLGFTVITQLGLINERTANSY